MAITRRQFFTKAAILAASTRTFFDMGAAWQKHGDIWTATSNLPPDESLDLLSGRVVICTMLPPEWYMTEMVDDVIAADVRADSMNPFRSQG